MTIDEIRRMSRRAYVNKEQGWTKVIFGADELQIVFKDGLSGIEAKKRIVQGDFNIKDVEPAVVCDTVQEIRQYLEELCAQLTGIRDVAERQEGFIMYDDHTKWVTDRIAYRITNVMTYGFAGGD